MEPTAPRILLGAQDRVIFEDRFPDLPKPYSQGRRLMRRPFGGAPSTPVVKYIIYHHRRLMLEQEMVQRLIDRIVADEPAVPFQADDPFTHSYFEFLRYFRDLTQIDRHHVIIGANFTYGWMPRMLRFGTIQFEQAAVILNRVKHNQEITDDELLFSVDHRLAS